MSFSKPKYPLVKLRNNAKLITDIADIFPYFGVWHLIGYGSNENKPNQINGQNSKWQMTSKQSEEHQGINVLFCNVSTGHQITLAQLQV